MYFLFVLISHFALLYTFKKNNHVTVYFLTIYFS